MRSISARDASEALAIVAAQPIDLVLADIRMPGINGLELVRQIHEFAPDLPCIVITGYGGAEQSVEALRAGAFWYLEKPFDQGHLDVVRRLVEQAIEMGRLRVENRMLQRELRSKYGVENIVGNSPSLRSVLDVVAKVADSDSTVLITGESGTGKELIARAIHYNSRRAERMLVTVNCGAIPEELLESELFGHVRGAFTNAVSHREGRFTLANEGTIFLDEIGDMSTNLQVKLLRVLAGPQLRAGGIVEDRLRERPRDRGDQPGPRRGDPRAALPRGPLLSPERDPDRGAAAAPPARGHPAARPALPRAREPRPGPRGPGPLERGPRLLCDYDWPGNVRELENLIERLVTLGGESEISAADLPANVCRTSPPAALRAARARDRPLLPRRGRGRRGAADPRGARAHPRQQEPRRAAARPQSHHAAREDEAPRPARPAACGCRSRRVTDGFATGTDAGASELRRFCRRASPTAAGGGGSSAQAAAHRPAARAPPNP